MLTDEAYIREAIRVASGKGTDPAFSSIGCVIVTNGNMLAARRNWVQEHHDAVAHAEIEAIRARARPLTIERCAAPPFSPLCNHVACARWPRSSEGSRIVYGAGREDVHEMYFEARHVDTIALVTKAYGDDLVIEGGI